MKYRYKNAEPSRIDKFLTTELEDFSREKIKSLIVNGFVKINGVPISKNSALVKVDDDVEIVDSYEEEMNVTEDIKPWINEEEVYETVFENEDYMIINKPKNLMVHPGTSNKDKTLLNLLIARNIKLSQIYNNRPGIVHRLDKDTTGLMIVAKTDKFYNHIQKQFLDRVVVKKYLGLVVGNYKNKKGLINAPIGRDRASRVKMKVGGISAKPSQTEFQVMESYKGNDLVEFNLLTGRTHQIRVHSEYLGCPIYNDPVYGKEHEKNLGQFLHSSYLEFNDLNNKRVIYKIDLPKYFQDKISTLINV